MDNKWLLYYLLLAGILVLGVSGQVFIAWVKANTGQTEHYMGVNRTHINDTYCKVYWLGGWDYDSFIGDIRVNNVSKGHVKPYAEIWDGNCREPVKVEMYERPVQSYLTIYNHSGGV